MLFYDVTDSKSYLVDETNLIRINFCNYTSKDANLYKNFQFRYDKTSRQIIFQFKPIQTRLPRPCFVFAWLINYGLPRSDHTVGLRVQDTNRTRERTRGIASRSDDKERNATTTASRKNAEKGCEGGTERGRKRDGKNSRVKCMVRE